MTDLPDPGRSTPLERRLGLADAVTIGAGSMIGAGVFTAWGPAADAAGTGLLIGLVVAAGVAFCNATSSAQLAAVHPESGGTYVYARRQLGPFWGHLAGWGFVVGKIASCVAVALDRRHLPVAGSRATRRRRRGRRSGRREHRRPDPHRPHHQVSPRHCPDGAGRRRRRRLVESGLLARPPHPDRPPPYRVSSAPPGSSSSPSPATPGSPPSARRCASPTGSSPRRYLAPSPASW